MRIYNNDMFSVDKFIIINGSINIPGQYELKDEMNISDLILEAGGIPRNIYSCMAEISRLNPKNKDPEQYAEIISISFLNNEVSYSSNNDKSTVQSFRLKPDDIVTIRPDPTYSIQKVVSIAGEVYYPGDYTIRNSNEMVTDIIQRSGGLKASANPDASSLKRNGEIINLSFSKIIKNPRSKNNFEVAAGDIIEIGGYTNLIKIIGEVNSPGNYQFHKGKNINDYVEMAGGLTSDASKYSSFITYPNGTSKQIKFLKFSPKVIDGSSITIGRKEDVTPFSFTEYATNITSIYADLSQAYLMILLASRQ